MGSENRQIWLATSEDAAAVLALLARQFEEHEIEVPAKQLQTAVEAMLADDRLGFFLLAEADSQTVGLACVSFCWTLEHGGKSAWLDELYVRPELRSQGIGSALIEEVLQKANEMGCAAIDLEVDIEHRRAEQLYQRFGFASLPRARWVKELR